MLCHSVRSWRSPDPLSFHTSSVAVESRENGPPLAVYLSSGSRPSRPTRMTLLTDFAIQTPVVQASALARTPRSRLQVFKLQLCTFSFTRIRKFFHNSFQSLDCLRCLIQFGEGEAFLVKGSTSFIVPGILLQEQIVVR